MGIVAAMHVQARAWRVRSPNVVAALMANAAPSPRVPIRTMNVRPRIVMDRAHVKLHKVSPMAALARAARSVRRAIAPTASVAIRPAPEPAKRVRQPKNSKEPTGHADPLRPRKTPTANARAAIVMVQVRASITTASRARALHNVCPGIASITFAAVTPAPIRAVRVPRRKKAAA